MRLVARGHVHARDTVQAREAPFRPGTLRGTLGCQDPSWVCVAAPSPGGGPSRAGGGGSH